MAEETVRVESNEDLDSLVQRLKRSGSKDVVLAVPEDARSLQTLDQFNVLRREVKDAGLSVVFMGGNKTTRGLAKILGFPTREGNIPGNGNGGNPSIGNETTSNPAIYGSEPTIPFPNIPNGNGAGRNGNGSANGIASSPYGMPEGGYVVNQNGTGPNQAPQMPPPNMPSYQDLINDVQNLNPGSLNRNQIQPPPNINNLNRPGDVPVTRENVNNFFGENPTPNFSRTRPEPEFSFSADEMRDVGPTTGSRAGPGPMSMEEAQRLGILGGNTANAPADEAGFFPNIPVVPMEEESQEIPYDDGDGVAAFRNRNTSGVRDRNNGKGKRNTRNNGRGVAGIAVPVALAGLGGRVRRIINPVQPLAAGTPRMSADMDQATRRRRAAASRNYRLLALLALLLIFLIAFVLIILNVTNSANNNNPGGNTVVATGPTDGSITGGSINTIAVPGSGKATVTLLMKSQQVQNKPVQLLFVPISGNAGPSVPPAAPNGGNVGTMQVKAVDTGVVEAKGAHPAFGSRTVSTPARGKVTIINRGSAGTGYSAGTVLFKANGVNYRTVSAVSIPGGNPLSGAAGTAVVDVVADDKSGDKGNLPNGTAGGLANAVAFQAGPITGGVNQLVHGVVSAEDVPDLQSQLVKQAQDTAQANIQNQYDKNTQGLVLLPTNPPTCSFDHEVGSDAPNGFTGSCKVSYKGYIYNKSDLLQAVQQEAGTPGQQIDPASLQPDYSKGKLESKNGNDFYTVPVSFASYTTPNLDTLKRAIANQPVKDVPGIITSQFGSQVQGVDLSNYKEDKLPSAENLDIALTTASGTTYIPGTGTTTSTAASGSANSVFSGATGSAYSGLGSPTATPNP